MIKNFIPCNGLKKCKGVLSSFHFIAFVEYDDELVTYPIDDWYIGHPNDLADDIDCLIRKEPCSVYFSVDKNTFERILKDVDLCEYDICPAIFESGVRVDAYVQGILDDWMDNEKSEK